VNGGAPSAAGTRGAGAPLCLLAIVLSIGLPGCEPLGIDLPSIGIAAPATTVTVEEPGDVKYYPSDEPARLGTEHFNRGNYGLAERYYRDAVEKAPRDVASWIGLAASYDRLSRFDFADRAYASAIRLAGETTQILNNQGYSYMLRGEMKKAREKFMKAYRREPNNAMVLNNLQLLNSSSRFVDRVPDQQQ
jgi:Flp pilus assembly protein TadD